VAGTCKPFHAVLCIETIPWIVSGQFEASPKGFPQELQIKLHHVTNRCINCLSDSKTNHSIPFPMAGSVTNLNCSNDAYLSANFFDLFSLKGRVVVITGRARGIGLAVGFAVAEAAWISVIIDTVGEPHDQFQILLKMCPKMKLYV
jgi:hypothetical protein